MGNGESKEPKSPSTGTSLSLSGSNHGRRGGTTRHSAAQQHGHARAGSTGRGLVGPSLLASNNTTSTTSTTQVHVHADASVSPSRSRPRSVTGTPHHFHPLLDALPTSSSHKSESGAMGNTDSKPVRPPSRANTIHVHTPSPSRRQADTSESEQPQPLSSPTQAPLPVDVPSARKDTVSDTDDDIAIYAESPYALPPANYSRPPRLPLPIEEEVHAPGSPIITPQDIQNSTTILEQADVEGGALPRKTSVLSSTTVDDDDVGDNEAFAPDAATSGWGEVRVSTKLEWNGMGDKIFVTGTFCNWEKKIKLHRNKDRYGFSAWVNLRPGTHHVKFLVDGEMLTSNELPTTVDWTNILVNYIEIVAPMPPTGENETQQPAPAAPMPIPGATVTAGHTFDTNDPAARPLTDGADARAAETMAGLPSTLEGIGPRGEHVGSVPGQPSNDTTAVPTPVQHPTPQSHIQPEPETKPTPALPKQRLPRPKYNNQIPEFLVDLDNYQNPDDERFQRAQRVASILPSPPSLPMFLSKSILNGATPHKDDASVLIMPNHTVLNHLATSSIKSGVLATSGTTRYKRKFLTTIMYKPTSDDG